MTAPETRAAAQERGWRTFGTGLAIDVAIAIAAAVIAWLPTADVVSQTAWVVLGAALIKTILQAVASYVLRLKLSPATEVDGAFDVSSLPRRAAELPPDGTTVVTTGDVTVAPPDPGT